MELYFTPEKFAAAMVVKEEGKKLFSVAYGGDGKVWRERPLRPELLQYACEDVLRFKNRGIKAFQKSEWQVEKLGRKQVEKESRCC